MKSLWKKLGILCLILTMFFGCQAEKPNPESPQIPSVEESQEKSDETNENPEVQEETVDPFSMERVANYVHKHGILPPEYVTKKEARDAGWDSQKGNLWDVLPGKAIGGDRFGNREGLLPEEPGRQWYEADLNYDGGHRGADRLVFSNDGLIYYTTDHYNSFTLWEAEE